MESEMKEREKKGGRRAGRVEEEGRKRRENRERQKWEWGTKRGDKQRE